MLGSKIIPSSKMPTTKVVNVIGLDFHFSDLIFVCKKLDPYTGIYFAVLGNCIAEAEQMKSY